MPYKSMEEANPALKGIKPPITLAQANMIARWADSIEEKGNVESPWAAAIALFKRTHHVEGDKWIKNEGSEAEHSMDDLEALEALVRALEEAGFEVITSEDIETDEGITDFGEVAYVVDLLSDVPQKDGKPDLSQPFRILPVGPIHRYGQRNVTIEDVTLFEDNWHNRTKRGIRRERVAIDVEHEPGAIGYYTTIYSRKKEGLWAKINLTPRGRKVLADRDFYFFSPTVAWESQDVKTGETIKNQIVGGALTNFPVLGDDTRLPLAYSEAALHRMLSEGHDMSAYATTKTEAGKEYPAGAYLVVEDPQQPSTWHLRVKEYVNGVLTVTKNMCGRAAAALGPKGYRGNRYTGPNKEEAKRKLRSLYKNTLKVPEDQIPTFSERSDDMPDDRNIIEALADLIAKYTKKGGGPTMPNDKTQQPPEPITLDPEAFAAMQTQLGELKAQVETLAKERETFAQKLAASEKQLAQEVTLRQLQEMREHVQTYSHLALPLELPEGAPAGSLTAPEHFAWLHNVDQTNGQVHWAFFNEVLKVANAALEEASLYTELGATPGQPLSEDEKLHRAAAAYAKEHQVDYFTALKAISGQPLPAA